MARCWYVYNGSGSKFGAGSYRRLNGQKPDCFSGIDLCALYLPSCADVPDFPLSQRMTNYLVASLSSTAPQPNIGGAKYFLYKIGQE